MSISRGIIKYSECSGGFQGLGGRGNGEFVFNSCRVSVGKMKKFWRVVMMTVQQCGCA